MAFKDCACVFENKLYEELTMQQSLRSHTLAELVAVHFAVGVPILLGLVVTTQFTIGYWLFRKAFYRNIMRLPLLGLFFK